MSDAFAPLALEFLTLHAPAPPALMVFRDQAAFERALYDFLATRYPTVELTAATVKHLGWSVGMLMYRPDR